MPGLTRRTLINRSIGAVAAGTLARPYVANAQAKTATVWWVQGVVPEEDEATRVLPELVKNEPWWTDPKRDLHVPPYVHQGFDAPTIPDCYIYNPGWAQVRSEQLFHIAFHDIGAGGMTPEAASDKAAKRCQEIFAKFEIMA